MDPYDYFAARQPRQIRDNIKVFWEHFAAHADELDALFGSKPAPPMTLPLDAMQPLEDINPNLAWEFSPSDKGHVLVITAEWSDHLIALARAVVQDAPEFARFVITDTRPGNETQDHLMQNFSARFRTPLLIEKIRFDVDDTNMIYGVCSGRGDPDELEMQCHNLVSVLMGEQLERDWFSFAEVEAAPASKGWFKRLRKSSQPGAFDPQACIADFRAAMAEANQNLPEAPYSSVDLEVSGRTLFQVEMPDTHPRSDMRMYSSGSNEFAQALLSPGPLSSNAHSKFGEWFCGLTLPNEANGGPYSVEDRYAIEEQVHAVLAENAIGGCVATGHGTHAIYLDVAITDIDQGLFAIGNLLKKLNRVQGAAMCFHDAGLDDILVPAHEFCAQIN